MPGVAAGCPGAFYFHGEIKWFKMNQLKSTVQNEPSLTIHARARVETGTAPAAGCPFFLQ
jgi:hypothetical protein